MTWQDVVLLAVLALSAIRVWQGIPQSRVARRKLDAWNRKPPG